MSRASALRDLVAALLIVGVILGGVWVWSGVWPPMVVIESSSMMHPNSDTPYGKIGTIDPGDMVFVKTLDPYANGGKGDVELWDEPGAKERFGMTGDVVVFFRDGQRTLPGGGSTTPVIHRAVAWVDVKCPSSADPTGRCNDANRTFEVRYRGKTETFNATGITIGDLRLVTYKPHYSGYLTKGDNPRTNIAADQAGLVNEPVRPQWIQGKARGEIPWFGLIKLAIDDKLNNAPSGGEPQAAYWVRVGNVYAPADLWVMLACSILAIIVVPLAWDVWRAARDRRHLDGAFEAVLPEAPRRALVKPIPPPGPTGSGGGRVTRFEVVAGRRGPGIP